MPRLRMHLVALLLAVGVAAVGPQSAWGATLNVRDRAATGTLDVSAVSGPARTTTTVTGALRARRWLRWVAFRCADRRCRTVAAQGRDVALVSPGRRDAVRRLRVRRAPAVRLELRAGRRLVSRRRIVPALRVVDPGSGGSPAPTGPPPPDAFALVTDPGLRPAYDPRVPDYTTQCTGAAVVLDAAVPAGQSLAVDGEPARTGTEFRQSIPLQPNQGFRFTVTDASGTHDHSVRCLPADFPSYSVSRESTPDTGWLAFSPNVQLGGGDYALIADSGGVPVWWRQLFGASPIDFKVLPDGSVAWGRYTGFGYSHSSYDNFSLTGTFLGSITTVGIGADTHDLQVLPNGNRLLMAYRPREHVDLSSEGGPSDAKVVDAEIQEVTPAGALVWSWNSKDHIPLSETSSWGVPNTLFDSHDGPVYDIVHINSVEADGDGVIFSARHLNAVYRIRRSDGGVDWKLGGTTRAESLAFVGDPSGGASFGGQHDARLLADGTLTLLDNGSGRNRAPRALRYSIDTTTRTATMLEQVVDARAPVSGCCNSARRLPSGRWVVTNEAQGTISELTAAGDPVLTLKLAQGFSYRGIPYAPSDLQRSTLRAGMDAMHPR